MKYIRTKEGIIVDTTRYKNVVERTFRDKVVAIDLNHWGQDNDKYPTWIDVKDIINQADTIEELCDFVDIQYKDGTWETFLFENEFRLKLLFQKAQKVFFGIRTDKGLIYVAKMNNQGELELL